MHILLYIKAATLDDLLSEVFDILVNSPNRIHPTKGKAREETGVLLELSNPRARLSQTETKGTIFSCLGELLWYLAYSNDLEFIKHYIPYYKKKIYKKGHPVSGAYGPRLKCMRGHDQVKNVINIIKKTDSRKAVIQLLNAEDISEDSSDTPCTCTLQFMNREGKLHMLTSMRSNDAFLGLSHDFFSFTMIQEIFARTAKLDVGTYKHVVGSLHLYKKHFKKAKQFLEEGFQPTTSQMPEMPQVDLWPQISEVLKAEEKIRVGDSKFILDQNLNSYWADLVRLLQVYSERKDREKIIEIKSKNEFECLQTIH